MLESFFSGVIYQEGLFISLLMLLNIVSVFALVAWTDLSGTLEKRFVPVFKICARSVFGSFSIAFVIAAVAYILPFGLAELYRTLVYLSVFSLFTVEMFLLYNFSMLINAQIIFIMLETHRNEILSFIKMYSFNLKSTLYFIALILGMIAATSILRNFINLLMNISEYVVLAALLGGFVVNYYLLRHGKPELCGVLLRSNLLTVLKTVYLDIRDFKRLAAKLVVEADQENVSALAIDNVVFVIGESTTRNHMGLYGYSLDTTPNLSRLYAQHKLIKFNDVVSPYAHTAPVLQSLLTFKNHENKRNWMNCNNLPDIVNLANYHTAWISNKEPQSIYRNTGTMFSERCNARYFNKQEEAGGSMLTGGLKLDGHLLEAIRKVSRRTVEKNFTIIHLMGTHWLYEDRYPKQFEKFTYKDIKTGAEREEKEIVAQYDNAVLYNDYVVNEIIKIYQDLESIVIYLPDHGEEVYDFRDFAGHTAEKDSRYMLEVPLLIWASDKFRAKYPEKLVQLEAAVDRPYMTDDFIHTLLDLLEVRGIAGFSPTRSIINEKFNAARKRIVNYRVDYDQTLKGRN